MQPSDKVESSRVHHESIKADQALLIGSAQKKKTMHVMVC